MTRWRLRGSSVYLERHNDPNDSHVKYTLYLNGQVVSFDYLDVAPIVALMGEAHRDLIDTSDD